MSRAFARPRRGARRLVRRRRSRSSTPGSRATGSAARRSRAAPRALAAAAPPPRRRRARAARRPAVRLAAQHERVAALRRATSIPRAPIPSSSPACSRTATGWRRRGEVALRRRARRGVVARAHRRRSAPRSRRPRRAARGPDAAAWRALADALPWLRRLHHETLRPPLRREPASPDPGDRPAGAAPRWRTSRRGWRSAGARSRAARSMPIARRGAGADPARGATSCATGSRAAAPPLLVTGARRTHRVGSRRARSASTRSRRAARDGRRASPSRAIRADLEVVDAPHARLPRRGGRSATRCRRRSRTRSRRGYTYLHAERRLVAYNLHEPGMERLHGPPLPFAREMVGARTAHEWAHLADAAGLGAAHRVARASIARCARALAAELDATIAARAGRGAARDGRRPRAARRASAAPARRWRGSR